MTPVRSVARALLGATFVSSGARALANPDALVPQAKRVTDRVTPLLERTDPRLPTDARTLVQLNAGVQLVGGLLLATGRLPRPAAGLLAGSLVPATLAGHPFWVEQDPGRRQAQRLYFLKNLGLLGGLLFAAADRQGRPSLGWRARHAVRTVRRETRLARGAARLGRRLPS
ncbi:MAG TPA: DoxX family protein [Micromonosporaceae bacterium]|nr:DoxX family protein [Micromonosporaceae bacterium]